ncbi:MAG: cell wall hydrolase [Clostridia bacterium]|nr:cell wall hydrolase [Clostridia bacterium]
MRFNLKKTVALLLSLLCLASIATPTLSAATQNRIKFPTNASNVVIYSGKSRVLEGEAAIIDSVTYVGLRAFCDLFGDYDISWNDRTKTASVKSDGFSMTATRGDVYIYANGRCLYTVTPIKIIDDRICVPIRPIAKALGVSVDWDGATRSVTLTKGNRNFAWADSYYNADDLYWLSRIISAEAKGESLKGQIAVGNVVLNRVRSKSYPNTIYGVIFDRKNGTQFSPVALGTIYQKPTASAVIAAKICLEGYTLSNDILFFMNPRIATNNWISKNRPYAFTIGNHRFYR